MENIIQLNEDFRLYRGIKENIDPFIEIAEIVDIPTEWRKNELTVAMVRENTQYYIDFLFSSYEDMGSCEEGFNARYNIRASYIYEIIYRGQWVGGVSHHEFDKIEDEKRLGNIGISLFNSFQSQGIGTIFTLLWLEYLRKNKALKGIYSSCDFDNIKSIGLLSKFRKRTPENDYLAPEDGKQRITFYLSMNQNYI